MNNVSFNPNVAGVSFKSDVEKVENTHLLKQDAPTDSVELSNKESKSALSKEDKQEILQKAKTKAAGWSVFGGVFSTLYYGLRSDKKVAEKHGLDPEADKAFVKQIKREQMISTLPGAIFEGVGGVISWLYNKNRDASKLEVK